MAGQVWLGILRNYLKTSSTTGDAPEQCARQLDRGDVAGHLTCLSAPRLQDTSMASPRNTPQPHCRAEERFHPLIVQFLLPYLPDVSPRYWVGGTTGRRPVQPCR